MLCTAGSICQACKDEGLGLRSMVCAAIVSRLPSFRIIIQSVLLFPDPNPTSYAANHRKAEGCIGSRKTDGVKDAADALTLRSYMMESCIAVTSEAWQLHAAFGQIGIGMIAGIVDILLFGSR